MEVNLVGCIFVWSSIFLADQTPTPTKFLRNCEEIGLFHELSKNPFEEAFKKAFAEGKVHDLHEVRGKKYGGEP